MVGDPGIEPGMSRLGGVTVRCRTLQHVAHWGRGIPKGGGRVKGTKHRCVDFLRPTQASPCTTGRFKGIGHGNAGDDDEKTKLGC